MVSDCSVELKHLYDDMKNNKEWEKYFLEPEPQNVRMPKP